MTFAAAASPAVPAALAAACSVTFCDFTAAAFCAAFGALLCFLKAFEEMSPRSLSGFLIQRTS